MSHPDSDHGSVHYRVEDGFSKPRFYVTLEAAMMKAAAIHSEKVTVALTGTGAAGNGPGCWNFWDIQVRVAAMRRDPEGHGDRELLIWDSGEYTREARVRGLDIPYLYPVRQDVRPLGGVFLQDLPAAWVRIQDLDAEPSTKRHLFEFKGRLDVFTNTIKLVHQDADKGKWKVLLDVDDISLPVEMMTIVWDKTTRMSCMTTPLPVLDWFVLDRSGCDAWLTDYAPWDFESLDEGQPQWHYLWINLKTACMEFRSINRYLPHEANPDRMDMDEGEPPDRPSLPPEPMPGPM